MSEKNDYFDYVSSVLGVKSVYIEPVSPQEAHNAGATASKEVIPLLVSVENLAQYSADERDLLEKMISALKIDLNKIKVCDVSQVANFEFAYLIQFSEAPVAASNSENVLITHSPRVLLKNPALKKQVWNEFQTVIKFFSN
ncbi:MAG: hypothetical protein K0R29_1617 [Pseudobdellovibrio sp.]|jgi:hypothetical protein|nr:hypothetical protein [Pseudobdellovibrio sp.]